MRGLKRRDFYGLQVGLTLTSQVFSLSKDAESLENLVGHPLQGVC